MALTPHQLDAWQRDGYLVLPDAIDRDRCASLRRRAEEIVADFDASTVSVFSTHEQQRTTDEHFLASANDVSCFFEEGAFRPDGSLVQAKEQSINKIGHAMHDLDPTFDAFSRQPVLAETARSLGFRTPLLLQSMYIFKQPRIGGEVTCHQDATFLATEPESVAGFWVAVDDATVANGCLWAQPGGHRGPLRKRFVRDPNVGTRFEVLDPTPFPEPGSPELVPLEVETGTLVVLHGRLPHWSDVNRSDRSRHAFTLHVIEGDARYPADNWLQRRPDLPLRGFATATIS